MVYIQKALGMYNLDENKIKNYVLTNINYSSIKNIYYSYKLSKILYVKIAIDYDLTYNLVTEIYDSSFMEYYLTTDKQEIDQEILYWISDMAVNDLSHSTTIVTIEYLNNCEFLSTGNNIIFNITSQYSGTYWLWVDGELLDSDSFAPNGDEIIDEWNTVNATYLMHHDILLIDPAPIIAADALGTGPFFFDGLGDEVQRTMDEVITHSETSDICFMCITDGKYELRHYSEVLVGQELIDAQGYCSRILLTNDEGDVLTKDDGTILIK